MNNGTTAASARPIPRAAGDDDNLVREALLRQVDKWLEQCVRSTALEVMTVHPSALKQQLRVWIGLRNNDNNMIKNLTASELSGSKGAEITCLFEHNKLM